jgi:hypothetical protein
VIGAQDPERPSCPIKGLMGAVRLHRNKRTGGERELVRWKQTIGSIPLMKLLCVLWQEFQFISIRLH